MARRIALLVFVAISMVVGPAMEAGASPSTTPCTIKITAMHFRPRRIAPGASSTVTARARNCTSTTQDASITWLGQFTGPTPGVPAGCPVIDPVAQPISLLPHGRAVASMTYEVFLSCSATELAVTARVSDRNGNVLTRRTAELVIS